MTETPEGFSTETLPPDSTLLVHGFNVNVGASKHTLHGQVLTGARTNIVARAHMIGERLRDAAPMEVTLVIPVGALDLFITRLTEARDVGLPLAQIEGELDGP